MKRNLAAYLLAGLTSLGIPDNVKSLEREITLNLGYSHTNVEYSVPGMPGFDLGDIGIPGSFDIQQPDNPNSADYNVKSLGISVNPFKGNHIKNFRLGYNYNFYEKISSFESNPIKQEGITLPISSYQRFAANNPQHEFTLSYKVPFKLARLGNLGMGMEFGYGKSSSYNVEAEQGIIQDGKEIPVHNIHGKNNGANRFYAGLYAFFNEHTGANIGYSRASSKVDYGRDKKDFDYSSFNANLLYRF